MEEDRTLPVISAFIFLVISQISCILSCIGSGEAAVTFAAAGYNPVKILKFTGPYLLIAIISCGLMAQIMYPLY